MIILSNNLACASEEPRQPSVIINQQYWECLLDQAISATAKRKFCELYKGSTNLDSAFEEPRQPSVIYYVVNQRNEVD
jgi:hypothetical protein